MACHDHWGYDSQRIRVHTRPTQPCPSSLHGPLHHHHHHQCSQAIIKAATCQSWRTLRATRLRSSQVAYHLPILSKKQGSENNRNWFYWIGATAWNYVAHVLLCCFGSRGNARSSDDCALNGSLGTSMPAASSLQPTNALTQFGW